MEKGSTYCLKKDYWSDCVHWMSQRTCGNCLIYHLYLGFAFFYCHKDKYWNRPYILQLLWKAINPTVPTKSLNVLWWRSKGIVGGRNGDRAALWDSSCSAASYTGRVSGEGSLLHTGVLWNSTHRLARSEGEELSGRTLTTPSSSTRTETSPSNWQRAKHLQTTTFKSHRW